MTASIDVSLSDEYPMAQAIVIISALPADPGGAGRPSAGTGWTGR
jgi:hypothetical protein